MGHYSNLLSQFENLTNRPVDCLELTSSECHHRNSVCMAVPSGLHREQLGGVGVAMAFAPSNTGDRSNRRGHTEWKDDMDGKEGVSEYQYGLVISCLDGTIHF